MSLAPKTIQIFLPSGDPQGIRIAEITTRIVQVIEVPRSLLADFLKMPESAQVALYFLVGESEGGGEPRVYIGQTGDLRARLVSHNREKDFWERALILISRTHSLTGTHALFLEWHCLQMVKAAGRYAGENGNGGNRPHTPVPLEADCLEMFETGRMLLATLGYPIFDPVVRPGATEQKGEIFYCRGSDADGRGLFTQEGFVVLEGSRGRKTNVPSYIGTGGHQERMRLVEAGIMKEEGDNLVFQKDHLFRSPSMAAQALMGRTANGWVEWRTQDGRTLDAIKRQEPA